VNVTELESVFVFILVFAGVELLLPQAQVAEKRVMARATTERLFIMPHNFEVGAVARDANTSASQCALTQRISSATLL